jgi:hypothetical protein
MIQNVSHADQSMTSNNNGIEGLLERLFDYSFVEIKTWKRYGTISQNHLQHFADLVIQLLYRFPGKPPERTDRQVSIRYNNISNSPDTG